MVDRELGLTIVFNGAIYNYPELRKQFIKEGYTFQSEGDTEVILKAYHKWGEDCPKHLHGMFAFAIWDEKKQHVFAVRDRMGIKPFYFSKTNEHFRFASNMQALLATGEIDQSIDPFALHNQFSLHAVIPAPRTIVNGIRKLEPGTSMTIDVNGKEKIQLLMLTVKKKHNVTGFWMPRVLKRNYRNRNGRIKFMMLYVKPCANVLMWRMYQLVCCYPVAWIQVYWLRYLQKPG
jgi:asparagine synthase (glutamine-hydrolysing)